MDFNCFQGKTNWEEEEQNGEAERTRAQKIKPRIPKCLKLRLARSNRVVPDTLAEQEKIRICYRNRDTGNVIVTKFGSHFNG